MVKITVNFEIIATVLILHVMQLTENLAVIEL